MNVKSTLAANLRRLMDGSAEFGSTPSIERATAQRGNKVGKSTIDRVLKEGTPFNLIDLEVVAKVFGKEPWMLICPPDTFTTLQKPIDSDWPFPNINPERFTSLRDWQKTEIQGKVRELIKDFEAENAADDISHDKRSAA